MRHDIINKKLMNILLSLLERDSCEKCGVAVLHPSTITEYINKRLSKMQRINNRQLGVLHRGIRTYVVFKSERRGYVYVRKYKEVIRK